MTAPRLLFDENFRAQITRGLARRIASDGRTPTWTDVRSAGLSGASDLQVLDWAAANGFAVVTHDIRTMPAVAGGRLSAGLPMAGLVVVPQRLAISHAIDDLLLVYEACDPEDLASAILYLPL